MTKHRRRKTHNIGREFPKPTDQRRRELLADDLHALSYRELRKRGKITEQIIRKTKDSNGDIDTRIRVNIVIDGTPRTVTLDSRG